MQILSKDSVTVAVDAVVYFRISNATVSITNVEDAPRSTKLLAQTTLRNILGTKTLAEMLSDREAISHQMQVRNSYHTPAQSVYFNYVHFHILFQLKFAYLVYTRRRNGPVGSEGGASRGERCPLTRPASTSHGSWSRGCQRSQGKGNFWLTNIMKSPPDLNRVFKHNFHSFSYREKEMCTIEHKITWKNRWLRPRASKRRVGLSRRRLTSFLNRRPHFSCAICRHWTRCRPRRTRQSSSRCPSSWSTSSLATSGSVAWRSSSNKPSSKKNWCSKDHHHLREIDLSNKPLIN